jgi:hypothetical protein
MTATIAIVRSPSMLAILRLSMNGIQACVGEEWLAQR